MADGYWAGLLWLAAAVLWWSGWRDELAGGLSPRAVRWFLALWPAGWLAGRTLPPEARPALLAVTMLTIALLLGRPLDMERRLTVWSAAVLGGVMMFKLAHPAIWLHGWIDLDPARDLPVLLGGFVALTLRTAREQLSVLSLALLMAACGSRWLLPSPAAWPAPEAWADMWWLAAAVSRAASLVLYRMPQALRHKWRGKAGNRA